MRIGCIIACVDYDDFLEIVLPYAKPHFDRVVVITSPRDQKTISCCKKHGVRYEQTEAWWFGGSEFNKGRALNVGIDALNTEWICTVDADTILPPDFTNFLCGLDSNCLYSAKRKLCVELDDYLEFKNGDWDLSRFDGCEVPIRTMLDGTEALWGNPNAKTINPAGVLGYLQIWNRRKYRRKFPTHFNNASSYDVNFAIEWDEAQRHWLGCEVLHLGWPKRNWNGRETDRWDINGK